MKRDKPLIVCFSGLDPTGGAGIQADIETFQALGCHALPIVSSLTVQTTTNVRESHSCDPELISRQFAALLDSGLQIAAIKIGLIDSLQVMRCISLIISQFPKIPVVADPVLRAGGGFQFGNTEMAQQYCELIVPYCHVLTPNTDELQLLSPFADTEERAATELCQRGCKYILLTGTHRNSDQVINRLYARHPTSTRQDWQWPRLPGQFHGSGCTLASAMAASLALGMSEYSAAESAQAFTWHSLKNALKAGNGQLLPDRRHHL